MPMINHDTDISQVIASIPEVLYLFKSGSSIDELSKTFMLDTLIIEDIIRTGLKILNNQEFNQYE